MTTLYLMKLTLDILLRWEELELLICGSPVLDFEALERVAQYDDGYSRDHPTIQLLWEVSVNHAPFLNAP